MCVGPKGSPSSNTYIRITEKKYWVVSDFNINKISFVKFNNLYCRVNGLYIAVLFFYM